MISVQVHFVPESLADLPTPVSAAITPSRVKKSAGTGLGAGLLLETSVNRSMFTDLWGQRDTPGGFVQYQAARSCARALELRSLRPAQSGSRGLCLSPRTLRHLSAGAKMPVGSWTYRRSQCSKPLRPATSTLLDFFSMEPLLVGVATTTVNAHHLLA